jgi:hypothetical protein
MATSGSFDFNLTTNEIIEQAYRKVGKLADGQTLTPEQFQTAAQLFNAMVKAWRTDNIFLWTLDWITVPFTPSDVVQGSDGFDYECIRNHTSSAANEPITGPEYPSFWRKLSTSSAPLWVTATDYKNIANIELDSNIVDIEIGRTRNSNSSNTRPIVKVSQEEYFELSDTIVEGSVTQYYFRRTEKSEIFMYPTPESNTADVLEFFVYRYPEDSDTGGDNADFLVEWLEALIDNLAVRLAPQAGIFGQQLRDLRSIAEESKENARKLDHETGDLFMKPNLSGEFRERFGRGE